MGAMSFWHWMIVLVVILIVFGAGKLPKVMGDAAKGIKAFRAGMKDDDEKDDHPTPQVAASAAPVQNDSKASVEGSR